MITDSIQITADIKTAMQIIDKSSIRMAAVTDENNILRGIVSDGDIRRALLDGVNINDPVVDIINPDPITVTGDVIPREIFDLCKEKDILFVPIIADDKSFVGLMSILEFISPKVSSYPVFIMAGGFGSRLAPLTKNTPKPMLHIGDKPILEKIINRLKDQGFRKFFISTHFLPKIIEDYFKDGSDHGVEIHYIHEEAPLGTGGALSLLKNHRIDSPIMVTNGDVLSDIDFKGLVAEYEASGSDSMICVKEVEHSIPYGVIDTDNGLVVGMIEKPTYVHNINLGVYMVSNNIISQMNEDEAIDMPTVLQQSMSRGEKVSYYVHRGYWLDIGSHDDFKRAQLDIKNIK